MSDTAPASQPTSLIDLKVRRKGVRDINKEHNQSMSPMDRAAVWITDKVGTMGFFLIILGWTILWCGYNILASEVTALHWKPFDPFPAFVAYLLISNVIQILLMPLIMVGQNVQGQHSELRAESDYEINCQAEKEIETILQHLENQQQHLEYQQRILIQLAQAQGIKLDTILTQVTSPKPA